MSNCLSDCHGEQQQSRQTGAGPLIKGERTMNVRGGDIFAPAVVHPSVVNSDVAILFEYKQ